VLALATVTTWSTVLINVSTGGGSAACPESAAGPPLGTVLASGALDAVAPVPPSTVKVRVLNAGGQRGQANLVAAQFADLGFAAGGVPENDPLYPSGDMACKGQIRFGPAGEGAASTVSMVVPCLELVRDTRTDPGLDVAVGTRFGDVNPTKAARVVLDELSAPPSGDGGGATPIDQAALQAARHASC
jgi:hypothetical protein